MIPSAQLTSEQLKEIIEDEQKTDQGARGVQEKVEDGAEDLDQENTSSALNSFLNTMNNKFEHQCLNAAVRLLNAHPIRQSMDDHVPGHKYSIPGLPRTKFLAHQVWAIWFTVSRWVWDTDMPGALVADEMGLGKTITSAAAAIICKLLTETVVMGLPLSMCGGIQVKSELIWQRTTFPELSARNGSGILCGDTIQCLGPFQRSNKLHHSTIQSYHKPLNQSWWSQSEELLWRSKVSSTRGHMEPISNSSTRCKRKMQISPMRIWTPVLTSQKTDGTSTLCSMIP